MPDEDPHESADLTDYETGDPADTLESAPGDDPLDRGVAPPQRWSAGMRYGSTAAEQDEGESLDQRLGKEEPDVGDGLLPDDGPDPRSGRLVAADEGTRSPSEADLVARDAGADGGGASAEEAAVHVVGEDDHDIRPGE